MNMTTLVKTFLNKFSPFFLCAILLTITSIVSIQAYAKENVTPLFITLSDAMSAINNKDNTKAKKLLTQLNSEFQSLETHDSQAGKQVRASITKAISQPNLKNLEPVSKALYAFEKEQNPINYNAKRTKFAKQVLPVYEQLKLATDAKNLTETQRLYKLFNDTWTRNEKAVRDTSLGHYGNIETAMTFYRVAMLAKPANFSEMNKQVTLLGDALHDFNSGNVITVINHANTGKEQANKTTLKEGVQLLQNALAAAKSNDTATAKEKLSDFIQQWPMFEGDVRTRDASLYTRVESELPVIMSNITQPDAQQKLDNIIQSLTRINASSNYSMFDAMLVLLREGVEALLIIMALLAALNASKQERGKAWVYSGAVVGVLASVAVAFALQSFFPSLSAGTNREIMEGIVGIIAVVMMLFIGGWLHSKSSMTNWKKFVDKQVTHALATGSMASMGTLSFLAVFREGAETILFYAGMIPKIAMFDLLAGIALAILLLLIIALVIQKSTARLPIHHLFKVMTYLLYALGFKMIGMSMHALQLTDLLSTHIINSLPSIPLIGFYATWETCIAQVIYLACIPLVAKFFSNRNEIEATTHT